MVAGLVALGALAGCGGSTPASVTVADPTSTTTAAGGKHVEQGSGHLHITIRPTSGPVGTVVHISATGCGDADGQNHAVSFNPDTSNLKPDAPVDDIPADLNAENLTAHYAISGADASGSGQGRFFVQCATDLADLPFTITK